MKLKNNLQKLSHSGYLTEDQYNFNIEYTTQSNQSIWVRRSLRLKKHEPIYVCTNRKNKTYYCDKCNTIKNIKYCRRCHMKLQEDKPVNNINDINISSESEQEIVNTQSSYDEMSDGFVVKDELFTKDGDDDYELPSEEAAFASALNKTKMLKKIGLDPFKYIVKQNCTIVDDIVISSDEDLMMDDSYSEESEKKSNSEKSKCYL
jgi:hypothetical protein